MSLRPSGPVDKSTDTSPRTEAPANQNDPITVAGGLVLTPSNARQVDTASREHIRTMFAQNLHPVKIEMRFGTGDDKRIVRVMTLDLDRNIYALCIKNPQAADTHERETGVMHWFTVSLAEETPMALAA